MCVSLVGSRTPPVPYRGCVMSAAPPAELPVLECLVLLLCGPSEVCWRDARKPVVSAPLLTDRYVCTTQNCQLLFDHEHEVGDHVRREHHRPKYGGTIYSSISTMVESLADRLCVICFRPKGDRHACCKHCHLRCGSVEELQSHGCSPSAVSSHVLCIFVSSLKACLSGAPPLRVVAPLHRKTSCKPHVCTNCHAVTRPPSDEDPNPHVCIVCERCERFFR